MEELERHAVENHVEFLERFCGSHCVGNWHCVTCHRNAELTTLAATHDMLKEFMEFFNAISQSPMAKAMAGGIAPQLPNGFGGR